MPKLELDENHIYRLDGRKIIGTTEALSILDDRRKDPWYLQRGSMVHRGTAYYDRGEFEDFTWDERIIPYVEAYVKFRQDTGFEPTHIELTQFHPVYKFAGTLDRLGPLNGFQVIIDLKSGAPAPLIDPLQNAAYWELCVANKIPVNKLFDLYLRDNGTYKLEPVEKPKLLLPVFLAALICARWKENL